MSGQHKSWVSRRVADLEARSSPKASSSSSSPSPSPSPSLKTKPVVFQREHRHPPPPSSPSEKRTAAAAAAAAAAAGRDMTVEHRLADQADIMAKRITDLEAALATSERRIARLSSAATAAATAPCHTRHADQAIADVERCCATRVGQLEDALMQAEKRASWLQEELKVVWACGAQRVRELEDAARQQQQEEEGEEKRSFPPGRSSGEESGEGMDKMEGTREALSGLRTRFYRVMRERNKLKSRCDRLSENLGKLNSNAPQNRETDPNDKDKSTTKSNQHGGCATRGDKSRCGVPAAAAAAAPAKSKERAPAAAIVDDMCSWRWSAPERAGTRVAPRGK